MRRALQLLGPGTLASLVAFACTSRPVATVEPQTSNLYVEPIRQEMIDKIDLLFMIDNSRSMGDKQKLLATAVPQLVDRLVVPRCVPEYHAPETPAPLVVALHGGSGHGRSFLWTWLKEARSRGVIVLAPTSRQDTWSLMDPAVDAVHLRELVEHVKSEWAIDESRILLTGMSDGGTFAYLAGLEAGAPYTHLAPVSATFHPLLLEVAGAERLRGLPVYLVHGALDWMFPVDVARLARDALTAAGADVTFREIADLSHTYPREENVRILDWLNSTTVEAASGRE